MAMLIDGGGIRPRNPPLALRPKPKQTMPVTYADRQQDQNLIYRKYGWPAPAAPKPPATPPRAAPVGGGGGGMSRAGGVSAQATGGMTGLSLKDFIKNNFLYRTQENENGRLLDDFDSATMREKQIVQADQRFRSIDLKRSQDDAGIDNAESHASRGTLRSGFTFQDQDGINAEGVRQQNNIRDLLTQFITQAQAARVGVQATGRNASNQVINTLTNQFNSTQKKI